MRPIKEDISTQKLLPMRALINFEGLILSNRPKFNSMEPRRHILPKELCLRSNKRCYNTEIVVSITRRSTMQNESDLSHRPNSSTTSKTTLKRTTQFSASLNRKSSKIIRQNTRLGRHFQIFTVITFSMKFTAT